MSETFCQRKEAEDSQASAFTRGQKVHGELSVLRQEVHKVGECSSAYPGDSSDGAAVFVVKKRTANHSNGSGLID